MRFSFESGVPIYLQVAGQIEDAILSGAFPEETQVPSTTEISVTYQINPATVLKGMSLLTDRQILYKKRGVGMFVESGAKEKIKVGRKAEFYERFVISLLKEAKSLGIGKAELIGMIEKAEEK